jgi:hypothetical protein
MSNQEQVRDAWRNSEGTLHGDVINYIYAPENVNISFDGKTLSERIGIAHSRASSALRDFANAGLVTKISSASVSAGAKYQALPGITLR